MILAIAVLGAGVWIGRTGAVPASVLALVPGQASQGEAAATSTAQLAPTDTRTVPLVVTAIPTTAPMAATAPIAVVATRAAPTVAPQPTIEPAEPAPTAVPARTSPTATQPSAQPSAVEAAHQPLVSNPSDLESKLSPVLASLGDQGSGVIVDPYGSLRVEYNATRQYDGGALLMVPVLVQTYQDVASGRVNWNDSLTVDKDGIYPGTGILQLHQGARVTIRDLAQLMIYHSDNTAANYLLDRVDLARVNGLTQSLQMSGTHLGRKFNAPGQPTDQERKVTTAADMASLFTMLARGQLVSSQASAAMFELLETRGQIDPFWIGTLLADDTPVAHITGMLPGQRTDAGYVAVSPSRGYVIVLMMG
ncbi:MAG: serine hydrolase, partial [Chloroflexota bacterium]